MKAVAEAAQPYAGISHVLDLAITHAEDCPWSDDTAELADCTCEIVTVTATRLA